MMPQITSAPDAERAPPVFPPRAVVCPTGVRDNHMTENRDIQSEVTV